MANNNNAVYQRFYRQAWHSSRQAQFHYGHDYTTRGLFCLWSEKINGLGGRYSRHFGGLLVQQVLIQEESRGLFYAKQTICFYA